MKALLNKATSAAAGVGLFFVGGVMASIGLTVVFLLAMFALAAIGLGILCAPFLAMASKAQTDEREAVAA